MTSDFKGKGVSVPSQASYQYHINSQLVPLKCSSDSIYLLEKGLIHTLY